MIDTTTEARAWIGSLAAYNNGRLIGAWIDLDGRDEDEITEAAREAMRPMIAGWMDEAEAFDELQVMDHEGIAGLVNGECSIREAVEAAAVYAEIDENALREAFDAYVSNMGPSNIDRDSVADDFRDAYVGQFDSLEAYAEDYAESVGMLDEMPANLRPYFDMASFARDMELGGDVYTMPDGWGGVYVFNG